MADQHRFNLTGLTDLIEELGGQHAERLPIIFELPDGRLVPWATLSLQMVRPGAGEIDSGSSYRALVIAPKPG